ncbi:MAG: HAMP domain-containing histidine kinase [Polyangiaceae bacterium]|nr:HAMP domain-containing histidine kinase [Polyangiaceae bacterium]
MQKPSRARGGVARAIPSVSVRVTRNAKPKVEARGRHPLLSAICHDLRAPLAAVTMGAHFVLQTTPNDQANIRTRRILEAMLRSCAQMERLVRNFADLSEIDQGSVALRISMHDAGEMLDLTADAARESARTKDVALEVQKPTKSILVSCDRERVLRALGHIVENAVRFAPEGSKIQLVVARGAAGVVDFAVTDHGPGLAPEEKKSLFDHPWQLQRADRGGIGFGVAIARGFAKAHDGTLMVVSRANEETTFTLALPIEGPQKGQTRQTRQTQKRDNEQARVRTRRTGQGQYTRKSSTPRKNRPAAH